ncbi:MAG: hypothetical protein ABSH25_08970 [Syntrophorhabdales bacterium]
MGNAAGHVRIAGIPFLAWAILFLSPMQVAMGSRAEPDMETLRHMKEIEFALIEYDREARPYYGYVKGSIPILISAPHGARHFRTSEGRWKKEDAYTSSLALELGKLTGAYVLYLKNKAGEDPNNDRGTAYKEFLKKVVEENNIRFVLDLHGADGRRLFKVDVGIMDDAVARCSCPTFRPLFEKTFAGFEPELFNKDFPAHNEGTITSFARKSLGIEAAQVEINARYRVVESKTTGFKADPERVLAMVRRLKKLILEIDRAIAEDPSRG